MSLITRHLSIVTLVIGLGAGQAQAQYQSANPFGGYSPYLNLLRGGGGLTSNYYGIVRPDLQFQANLQAVQRQAQANANATVEILDVGVSTGVYGSPGTGFMNHGGYFGGGGLQTLSYTNRDILTGAYTGTPGAAQPGGAGPANTPLFNPRPIRIR